MREKEKTPEKQLSEEEILSLQEKDFRLLMVKMIQDIGNKLEAKMDNLQETVNKEIQDIKLKQEEMQNTITEIKKSMRKSRRKLKTTLKQMIMKTQPFKIYGMLQKQCSEGNSWQYRPSSKKKRDLKLTTHHLNELEKEQKRPKVSRRKEIYRSKKKSIK